MTQQQREHCKHYFKPGAVRWEEGECIHDESTGDCETQLKEGKCPLSRPHTPAPEIPDAWIVARCEEGNGIVSMDSFPLKEHDALIAQQATLAAEQTDHMLDVLKNRYKNEMVILDYVEMIECEVMALRQQEQHP
jgi:hypothetical protein